MRNTRKYVLDLPQLIVPLVELESIDLTTKIKYAFNRELNLVCKQIDRTDSLGME